MNSFFRIKKIHGKEYKYEIIPYYDKETKKVRQKSRYIGPVNNGKVVEKTVTTYSYGDLLPVMKVLKDINLPGMLKNVVGEYATTVLIMAINRVIRPEAMNNLESWYDDSYLKVIYPANMNSSNLSKVMEAVGNMNPNHGFLKEILKYTGDSGAMYYDLTSFSSHSRNIEFLEYGYSRSDPDFPQVNISLIEDRKTGLPIFYDIYPGSVVDVSTVKNTVDVLKSAGVKNITFIMDRGMFSTENIEYLILEHIDFIMPATYSLRAVKKIALQARRKIERGNNMIHLSGEIIFAEEHKLNIGNSEINTWVYYDPERDKRERSAFYLTLHGKIEHLRKRQLRRYEKPVYVVEEIMGGYLNFITWKYDRDSNTFTVRIKENAVSQRVNRCGITIIAFTGEYDPTDLLMQYRKRDSVEKLFLSWKSFLGAEPLRVHGLETLRGNLFVNIVSLAIRSAILNEMKKTDLANRYSIEKILLELHKVRKVKLQNGKEIMTEITKRERDIIEKFSIKSEHVPTFLTS